jgi:hypothetical protein
LKNHCTDEDLEAVLFEGTRREDSSRMMARSKKCTPEAKNWLMVSEMSFLPKSCLSS